MYTPFHEKVRPGDFIWVVAGSNKSLVPVIRVNRVRILENKTGSRRQHVLDRYLGLLPKGGYSCHKLVYRLRIFILLFAEDFCGYIHIM